MAAGKLPQAIELFEQVRDSQVKKLGPDHPDTLTTLNALGVAYWRAGKLPHALPLFEQAAADLEKHNYVDERVKTAHLQYDCGLRSRPAIRQGGKLATEMAGGGEAEHRRRVTRLRKRGIAVLGLNLLDQRKYTNAEPILRECLDLREKLLEDNQATLWQVANAKSMLGEALMAGKKPVEAESLLLAGYEGLRQDENAIPDVVWKVRVAEAIQHLIDLARAKNKPDDVKKWQAELTGSNQTGIAGRIDGRCYGTGTARSSAGSVRTVCKSDSVGAGRPMGLV